MPSTRSQNFRIKWHQSSVLRAASLVTIILLCAYVASIIIGAQGFDTIVNITRSIDVEDSFQEHLESIKEIHVLKQEAYISRLKSVIPSNLTGRVTEKQVKNWIIAAKVEHIFPSEGLQFNEGETRTEGEPLYWSGKQKLRVYNVTVSFPRGKTYHDFLTTEETLKRYKVITAQLESDIKPALIKANALVLLLTFLLLIGAFLFILRLFNRKVESLIRGIAYWSEVDQSFRFGKEFSGELKLICHQFNRMADEVEENRNKRLYLEKIASWQTIARKLAHEIKNPLTPIQMMITQLSKSYQGDDEKFKKLLESSKDIIIEEVDALRRMVDHFSKFARLPEPKKVPTDLVELVQKTVELQKVAFPDHTIALRTQLSHCEAHVDPDLIRQVLLNLIKNAAEASAPQPSVITLSVEDTAKSYLIKICDNGPGIPPESLDKVFEAYFTTKHTGPNPGMGLGLAVCQKILLDHFGELRVTSRPGETIFTLVLPKENL